MPEALFALAEDEEILVRFCSLPADLLGAYYSANSNQMVILLHGKIKHNRRLLRCVLAEELGHHFTTSHNLLAFARTGHYERDKCERLAVWWAVQHLMPLDRLIAAVNSGLFFTYELAEHFDVTERFAGTGIKLYFNKKGDVILKLLKRLPEEINY